MKLRIVVSTRDRNRCVEICDVLARRLSGQIIAVGELYDLADQDGLWEIVRGSCDTLIVLAEMYPRPVECLLVNRQACYSDLHVIDIRGYGDADLAAEQVMEFVELGECDAAGDGELIDLHRVLPERWYPIIDRGRCISCGQCEQFCLFGVYSNSEGVCRVTQPDSCKPGCPACSRICPQGAVIFPRYEKDPAIAGSPGHIVSPDPEARRLYYKRTGSLCPVCSEASVAQAYAGGKCPECGRDIPDSQAPLLDNELDKLIDEFDKLQFGR